jgi:uncharacterized protein YgiB involved in biofilm formation
MRLPAAAARRGTKVLGCENPRRVNPSRLLRELACVLALMPALGSAPAVAQPKAPAAPAPALYSSRAECEAAGRLSREQCGFAFTNARAEFEEKAPRYRARRDCVRVHSLCSAQIVGASGFNAAAQGAAIYVPSFRGVSIIAAKAGEDAPRVLPRIAAGASRFASRSTARIEDRMDGRVAVVPDSLARRGAGRGGADPQSSGPYVRRGDRDDTLKMKLEVKNPNDPNATGLFVDKDGVEWYRPARRR